MTKNKPEIYVLFQVFLEVHALPLANEAPVDLSLGQGVVDVLTPLLFGHQLFVHFLCDLVFLVQVLSSVLDAHPADDAVEQLGGREVAHCLALCNT